jgi:hypothetical protein
VTARSMHDDDRRPFRIGDRVTIAIGRSTVAGEVATFRLALLDGAETQLLGLSLDDGRMLDGVPAAAVALAAARLDRETHAEIEPRLVDVEAIARRAASGARGAGMVSIDETRALAEAYLAACAAYEAVAARLNEHLSKESEVLP